MLDFGVSDFVGILMTIGLFAYLTTLLQWGFFQMIKHFFKDEEKTDNIFHHHFHYKSRR